MTYVSNKPPRLVFALFLSVAMTSGPVDAEDWATRSGDTLLSPQAMVEQLTGRDLEFYDGGRSRYSAGGSYSYTYAPENGGGTAFGTYEFRDDSVVCAAFRNGFSRCDMVVENAGRLIVITEDGERYPVRPE